MNVDTLLCVFCRRHMKTGSSPCTTFATAVFLFSSSAFWIRYSFITSFKLCKSHHEITNDTTVSFPAYKPPLFVPVGCEWQTEFTLPEAVSPGAARNVVQLQELLHQFVPRHLHVPHDLLHPVRRFPADHGTGRRGSVRLSVVRCGRSFIAHYHRQPAGAWLVDLDHVTASHFILDCEWCSTQKSHSSHWSNVILFVYGTDLIEHLLLDVRELFCGARQYRHLLRHHVWHPQRRNPRHFPNHLHFHRWVIKSD